MKSSITLQYSTVILILFSLGPLCGQQVEIDSAIGGDAISITYAGEDGIQILKAERIGYYLGNAELYGYYVFNAGRDGVVVDYAGHNGVFVDYAGDNGVYVDYAEDVGVYLLESGGHGFQIDDAQFNGLSVGSVGGNGVYVGNAGNNGVFVGNAESYSMNIQGDKNTSAGPSGHIAQIYNRSAGTSPDVLALKVGKTGNPGGGVNFITFYNGDDEGVGRIEGNGSGGVLYGTTGADFAECLPLQSADEQIRAGDIVGVYKGHISLRTIEATTVMVITDRPAVLGNQKEGSLSNEKVSFIGQVPVNVIGQVEEGDWIVASGAQDGTAIAVPRMDITLKHQIVGRAWESNADEGIKKVLTAVGLSHSEAKDAIIEKMENEIKAQQESIDAQQVSMEYLQGQINKLTRLISVD